MAITHFEGLGLKQTIISGGSAGDHTVSGISTDDQLIGVVKIDGTADTGTGDMTWACSDLASEFSITADDTINNTGGTDTTGAVLLVTYLDYDA